MAPSRIVALATAIQAHTIQLNEYFAEQGLPPPSFEEGSPLKYDLPPDIAAAQEALNEALDELASLNQGAVGTVFSKTLATSIGLKFILRYKIYNLVPFETGTTFEDLARETGVPVKKLTRILRQAFTDHLFCEPTPGRVKHTSASQALVFIPLLPVWCEMAIYEVGPAKMQTVDAVAKWPDSEEPNHTGWNLAQHTEQKIFDFLKDHPDRGSRFKDAMAFLHSFPGLGSSYVIKGFDWASLGDATVVDVGGSHGEVSLALAKEFPRLRFIVQDLPEVINDWNTGAPAELASRVTFMAHDFFTEQPVKDADVYYFRWIFHDWSDKYCIKILQSLIPALKPGAKIILSEKCLSPPCTLPLLQQKFEREADVVMLAVNNSAERDEKDWYDLFRAASTRFTIEKIERTDGARLEVLTIGWN